MSDPDDDRALMVTIHKSGSCDIYYPPTLTREEFLEALSRLEHLASETIAHNHRA